MTKNIFLILTVTIFLSCCGCNNTTTTIDTGSWIEVEDKTENEKNNSSSDIESNTNSKEDIVSDFSNIEITSSEYKETDIKRPEKVTKVFSFKCEFAKPNDLKKEIFYDIENDNVIPYRLFIPEDYDQQKEYPIILFLHGAGESGTDNEKQLGNIKKMFEKNGDLLSETIIVCPQTITGWNFDKDSYGDKKGTLVSVIHLLDEIKKNYSCDNNRIYVTGLSMGGNGTWKMLAEYGNIFAAGIPICGWGDETKSDILKEIPIRIYHSKDDPTVSFAGSMEMYQSILKAGGKNVKFIELDGLGHNSWDYAYSDREAFSWLLAQNKKNNPTGDYQYIPYFRVVDKNGKIIISDEDIIDVYNSVNSDESNFVPVELVLNSDGVNKLKKSYKENQNREFTVYWSIKKMYTFTVNGMPIDNIFSIVNVFTWETYPDFSNTLIDAIF